MAESITALTMSCWSMLANVGDNTMLMKASANPSDHCREVRI